jgi:hypothetical protein
MRSSSNYRWIESAYPEWFGDGYCAALVRTNLDGVLAALGGGYARRSVVGLASGLGFLAFDDYDVELEVEQPVGLTIVSGNGGPWTLLAQSQSTFIGIDDVPMLEVLGERYEVVSHANVNGYGQFVWWREGTCQVRFEPMLASSQLSAVSAFAEPGRDRVVELIAQTGGIDVEPTDQPSTDHIAGSFALADALTGVHLTRDVLDTANITLAVVAMRPGQRWDRQAGG